MMKDRLRELIDYLNISQSKFAASIGIDQSSVSNYISGTRRPTRAVCRAIVMTYSVNPEWLYKVEGPMFVEEIEREKMVLIAEIKNMSNEEIELLNNFMYYMHNTKKKWDKLRNNG